MGYSPFSLQDDQNMSFARSMLASQRENSKHAASIKKATECLRHKNELCHYRARRGRTDSLAGLACIGLLVDCCKKTSGNVISNGRLILSGEAYICVQIFEYLVISSAQVMAWPAVQVPRTPKASNRLLIGLSWWVSCLPTTLDNTHGVWHLLYSASSQAKFCS